MALSPTAFLVHQGDLHFTESITNPVSTLIESIWDSGHQFARAITRNRIYFHQDLDPICEGMLKVAAKRATRLPFHEFLKHFDSEIEKKSPVQHHHQSRFFESPIPTPTSFRDIDHSMSFAMELAKASNSSVGSILIDDHFNLISWGWNDHFKNRVLHAEVMVIKNYQQQFKKKIPEKCLLITTLQPCAMCAGYLHAYSEDFSSLRIIFSKEDLGPFAQNSILIPGSDLYKKSKLTKLPCQSKHTKKP